MFLRKNSINKPKKEYDILSNISPQELNFIYCQGLIDKQIKKFIFRSCGDTGETIPNSNNTNTIAELDLLLINKIIITKQTKNKIIMLQLEKKQERLQSQSQKGIPDECLSDNRQYLQSRYFIFYLDLKNGERIELILNSYENFKKWINGISSILQSKSFHM